MANHDIDVESFQRIRNQTVSVCQPLEIEDYIVQPIADVSPPKWHLAHTSWFFENFLLCRFVPGYQKFDNTYDELFNSYYKSVGKHWLQARRGILSRPTVSQVLQYREHVDRHMAKLLSHQHQDMNEIAMLTEVGLHHEQQHQELLYMDIKYILAANPSLPAYDNRALPLVTDVPLQWMHIDAGLYQIGANTSGFTFDNETPTHQHYQHPCAISNRLITNGEYRQFIEDKGYENPLLWLSAGWDWLQNNQVSSPLYWHRYGEEWFEFSLHGNGCLNDALPVMHINYFEASAYAKWCGARLPTEQELEIYFIQEGHGAAIPQTYCHATDCAIDKRQLWIWTQSPYIGYPGYESVSGALGEYNGKFMCNQVVLRGGCFVTEASHYRPTYRNFYMPHQNWMFSGICLAKDR